MKALRRMIGYFTIPPVYADRPSDATLAEGWRIAYEQEKERRELAEAKLALRDGERYKDD